MAIGFRILTAAALAAVSASAALAADESPRGQADIVVSASRIAAPAGEIGAAATVIDRRRIEDSQTRVASDILRRVPGLAVSRGGPVGALTQIRIRGAEANHTQVRIDGIEAGDPSSTNGFDFANLLAADIERVTVLRGPQSALYGSDAMAGVIDIRSRRGEGPFSIEGFAEGGAFATATGHVRLGAGDERRDYAVSVTGLRGGGINIARSGSEKDGYRNLTASFVGAVRPRDSVEIEAAARYTRSKVETDGDNDFNGIVEDTDDNSRGRFFYGRLGGSAELIEDRLTQKVEAALTDTRREPFISGSRHSYEGDRLKLGTQSILSFRTPGIEHGFVAGYEREEAGFDKSAFGVDLDRAIVEHGAIGEYRVGLIDRVFLSGAARRDWNDYFGDATTWRATAAILAPEADARLHASYGTGITDPTFDDLFGFDPRSFVGNPSLRPEKSRSHDVGVELSLAGGRAVLDVTYFRATLEEEIVSTPVPAARCGPAAGYCGSVVNRAADSKRRGVEVSLTARPAPGLSLRGGYTYTRAKNHDGTEEIRRPRHLASLDATYRFLNDRAAVNLGIDHNGGQKDYYFRPFPQGRTVETLGSYTLVNLAASYRITDGVALHARLENALDETYEEVFSYSSPGIAGFAGVRVRLWPD